MLDLSLRKWSIKIHTQVNSEGTQLSRKQLPELGFVSQRLRLSSVKKILGEEEVKNLDY